MKLKWLQNGLLLKTRHCRYVNVLHVKNRLLFNIGCKCKTCKCTEENWFKIESKTHAEYLHDIQYENIEYKDSNKINGSAILHQWLIEEESYKNGREKVR